MKFEQHYFAQAQEKSKANLHVFGISRLTKNHQYKIRLRRRLTSQILICINTWCLNFLRNTIYNEKCTHSTFSMSKTRSITQIRPDD